MGILAELVKAAEEKQAVDPTITAQKLEELRQRIAAAPPASEALGALERAVPTSESESTRNALKWLAITSLGSAAVGALFRAIRAGRESSRRRQLEREIDPYRGIPGREITIPLPHMKRLSGEKKASIAVPAAIAAATGPAALRAAGGSVGESWENLKGQVSRGMEHLFTPTGSPFDKSWFLPAAIGASLVSGYLGYSELDKLLDRLREKRVSRQMARARREFEDALRAQYREAELAEEATKGRKGSPSGGFKFSAAGMMGFVADAFAQSHINGEFQEQLAMLEKSAQQSQSQPQSQPQESVWQSLKGGGRKALGVYLATLALLSAAGAGAGYSLVKSREPRRRKHEIAKEILRRRAIATPPTVTVEPV